MRIKLNLKQVKPDNNSSVYWLHVDITRILFIKHLKEKVQKVLKVTSDIDLCFDNVPFLDEDDIHVINENEEITVIMNDKKQFETLNSYTSVTRKSDSNIAPSNNISSTENVELKHLNDNESSTSSMQPTNSTKRPRKRKHKKKTVQLEPVEPIIKNDCLDQILNSSTVTSEKPNKMHKRFKLENEEKVTKDDDSDDSLSEVEEECLHVTREIFRCDSSYSKPEKIINNNQTIWKKEKPLKTKVTKVPVFVRGQMLTPKYSQNSSFTENENNKTIESNTSEDYDMLVVDWKNMSSQKISNISELKISDLLQFKILIMNEYGEAALSSVITARLETFEGNTLLIQVLSGVKEFSKINERFIIDEVEKIETQREVVFEDLFELNKLV